VDEPIYAKSLEELRDLSDDQLIELHDSLAPGTTVGINYYLEELARRRQETANKLITRNTLKVAQESERLVDLTRAFEERAIRDREMAARERYKADQAAQESANRMERLTERGLQLTRLNVLLTGLSVVAAIGAVVIALASG
jgi:hypothetical protein